MYRINNKCDVRTTLPRYVMVISKNTLYKHVYFQCILRGRFTYNIHFRQKASFKYLSNIRVKCEDLNSNMFNTIDYS